MGAEKESTGRRPGAVIATIVVLAFLGISAAGGSSALLVPDWTPPNDWLGGIPVVTSWVIPGLVLLLVFGVGSLVVAWGVWRRPTLAWLAWVERATGRHWSWAAALALGVGQVAWIALELAFLPEASALQAVYGTTGVVLCILALLPSVRRHLRTRRP